MTAFQESSMADPMGDGTDTSVVVLIPVYDDWDSVAVVVDELDNCCQSLGRELRLLIVDDGSYQVDYVQALPSPGHCISRIDILCLRHNLGHQRAIAVGLAWLEANSAGAAVVIMDADGEDAPSDVPRLIKRFEETGLAKVVFAARKRRSEGVVFQVFYHAYRVAHRLLTGISVRVGNFSLLPWPLLRRIVVVSELWNHYAASVFKARLPMTTIPTVRAPRLAGRSSMNFTALVMHGLSAMSVLGDRISVRLLIAAGALLATVALVGLTLAASGVLQAAGIGSVSSVAALVVLLVSQILFGVLLFAFQVLGRRDTAGFLPIRDYPYFVDRLICVWGRDAD